MIVDSIALNVAALSRTVRRLAGADHDWGTARADANKTYADEQTTAANSLAEIEKTYQTGEARVVKILERG